MIPDYEQEVVQSDEEKVDIKKFNGKQDVGSNLIGWNEIPLKEQIKKAIRQIGFEYPSEVQKKAIPIIMQGKDILCQARSGMGKTAVFIIGVLNQLVIKNDDFVPFSCIVLCHTRELAHQVFKDFRRFGRYLTAPQLRTSCFFGGLPIDQQRKQLKNMPAPHIVIGTPGRLKVLIRDNLIPLDKVQYLIIDECDQILSSDMRKDLQKMFEKMKHSKQVMMFSATMPSNLLKSAKQYMNNSEYICVDSGKLILDGLTQFNVFLLQKDKVNTAIKLLDKIQFNQAVIFVNKVQRAKKLTSLLQQKLFNPICIHSNLTQAERLINYDNFKNGVKSRLLIATDLFGRGIDIQKVNLVINYDLPHHKDSYLHRVGRAGRFNTRGLAINFICKIGDQQQQDVRIKDVCIMKQIQQSLHNPIPQLPENFNSKLYI